MLRIIPWTVLKPILSAPVPTIQAFAASVLEAATNMKNIQVVSDLLENGMIQSSKLLWIRAVQISNAELVRLFLRAKARADHEYYYQVPLLEAETVEIARTLVEAGADVNAVGPAIVIDGTFIGMTTALCAAVWKHDVKLTRYLISAGANVNLTFDCGTPLEVAACRNQRESFELLLELDAFVNQVERSPFESRRVDALQHATISGNLNFVRLLIETEADVNAPAYHSRGMTALQAASVQSHLEMITFFFESWNECQCLEKLWSSFFTSCAHYRSERKPSGVGETASQCRCWCQYAT